MWRFALREGGRLALGLTGALVMAGCISALSLAQSHQSLTGYAFGAAGRLWQFARLDFGISAVTGTDALRELGERGPTTVTLVLLGAAAAVLLGLPLGIAFGAGPLRRATAPLIQIVAAAPVFCASLALGYVAQRWLHWPASVAGQPITVSLFRGGGLEARAVLLPILTVGLAGAAAIQLALRRAWSAAQTEPFRAGLWRLGLSAAEIDRAYVAPLALAGLLASLGEVVLALLSAAVVAEWVFRCRGIADLFVTSIALQDWNMAAVILLAFAAASMIADTAGRIGAYVVVGTDLVP